MRERDGYRQQLEAAQRAAPAEGAAKRGGEAMDVDEGPAKKVGWVWFCGGVGSPLLHLSGLGVREEASGGGAWRLTRGRPRRWAGHWGLSGLGVKGRGKRRRGDGG